MRILVANLGSTSFKFRLIDMADERTLARGGIERIGESTSRCTIAIGDWQREESRAMPHHGAAVDYCLAALCDPQHGCIESPADIGGIGFKAVHGGRLSGVVQIDEDCFNAMEEMNSVAPAHNPPYVAAMRQLAKSAAGIPLVAAFETDFHRTAPLAAQYYAIPRDWSEQLNIRRWGFHGASHRYIATRTAQLLDNPQARIISCHLGGSSSLCAIQGGRSQGSSMGMSPQTGLPQNNRVGDLDPFALPRIMQHTGQSLEEVLMRLASDSGLLGLSGKSGDLRDIEAAASAGDADCQLALDVFVHEIRRYLGGCLVQLGGADAIVFTGGIGENSAGIRGAVCSGLQQLGIVLDQQRNEAARGEATFHAADSRIQLWTVPTNEEIIVARQCLELLEQNG